MPRPALIPVLAAPAALCALWTVLAGKDVSWDLLNYHYYLPFELVAGRLSQDFFAASAQSYLNPVGYLPFYLMLAAGWHSVGVSIVLAVAHSLSIALLYLLAWKLFGHLAPRSRAIFAGLAAALGVATAVWWSTVGGSFLDPLLLPPMLAGLLLLLQAGQQPLRLAALAGALFGAAAALKYSNAIFALAALPLALALPGSSSQRLRAGLAYAAAGALAVAVLAGPWLMAVWREFGNPVFPLMNGWFRSPDALAFNPIDTRFALEGPLAWLAFPFRMVALDRGLYVETFAPDLRFAALTVAMLALAAVSLTRAAPGPRALRGADARLLAFFATSLVLWLATSANGRYGMLVLLLAGVCLARLAERLLPPRGAAITLAVLLAVQIGLCVPASPPRWFLAEAWSRHWLPYVAPERALREPALYVSVEVLTLAAVAPFLHPDASLVNLRGQHSIPGDSPKLAELLERHRGRVRSLGRGPQLIDAKPRTDEAAAYDAMLRRIGYRIDAGDCFVIAWQPDEDALARLANRLVLARTAHEPLSMVSCALRAAPREPADIEAERRMSVLFDRIEKACPRLFRAQSAVTEPFGAGWSRTYNGLDARLEALGGRAILNRLRRGERLDLGPLAAWDGADPVLPKPCGGG
jgi:4-amino-4-deoxy-L-arabinose transferase-like glycosyltransferase